MRGKVFLLVTWLVAVCNQLAWLRLKQMPNDMSTMSEGNCPQFKEVYIYICCREGQTKMSQSAFYINTKKESHPNPGVPGEYGCKVPLGDPV